MTQLNILELAKQGDTNALSHLFNQYLQPQGITAKASCKHDCLKVVLESVEVPEQDYLVAFILMEVTSLEVKSIRKVKVYGQQAKTFDPAWYQEFELEKQVELPSSASAQSTCANTQANYQKELSRNRVSEIEFRAALEECAKTARQTYERTVEYSKQAKSILQKLNINISATTSHLLRNKDAERFEFARVLKDIVSEVKQLSQEGIEDLISSLNTKRNHLEDFTIALFGRTKAGKSTICEALTRGDGHTIGKGSQRTTRDMREYRWQGLRLLDTPGIEAYQGEEDTAKANEVIDQSDMLIFLTSDDSVQPDEFSAMAQLHRINKYFAVILNIKHDISNQLEDLLMFIDIPEMVFNEQRLAEHQNHIRNYTKEHLKIDNVDLVYIHAQAGFLSTKPKYQEYSQRLWELSKIEELYYLIASDIQNNGQRRRMSTFFDGAINFISEIEYKLDNGQDNLYKQVKFMMLQKVKLKPWGAVNAAKFIRGLGPFLAIGGVVLDAAMTAKQEQDEAEHQQKLRQARAEMRQDFRRVACEMRKEYEVKIEKEISFYDEEIKDIECKQKELSNTEQSKVDIVSQIENKRQEIQQEIKRLMK